MRTNSKLNILIVTPFALWMYIICISNIIMQELSGAPYVAGIITYVSAFIIFLCYYWLLLQNIRKMGTETLEHLKSQQKHHRGKAPVIKGQCGPFPEPVSC